MSVTGARGAHAGDDAVVRRPLPNSLPRECPAAWMLLTAPASTAGLVSRPSTRRRPSRTKSACSGCARLSSRTTPTRPASVPWCGCAPMSSRGPWVPRCKRSGRPAELRSPHPRPPQQHIRHCTPHLPPTAPSPTAAPHAACARRTTRQPSASQVELLSAVGRGETPRTARSRTRGVVPDTLQKGQVTSLPPFPAADHHHHHAPSPHAACCAPGHASLGWHPRAARRDDAARVRAGPAASFSSPCLSLLPRAGE